jgi:DNA-3-methyladenine glycosylase I
VEREYHDREWGVELHDDLKLFEFLILDTFQAGLSWSTILSKRDNFRKAFDNFDPVTISSYTEEKLEALMQDAGIIRNRMKIHGAVKNAKAYLAVAEEFGSFDRYIWSFVDGKRIVRDVEGPKDWQATSPESDAMSKDMKKRGFSFCGSTICYAFMQAAGLIDDHFNSCSRKMRD